jgi:tetratricopeptide (TPR) repeat protein
VIELILEAERSLSVGRLDQAEQLYRQASELDPRNSIAVVGLARVALERDDEASALHLARRALTIDPENAAARRLADRLEEVIRHRGDEVPADAAGRVPPPRTGETAPGRRSLLDRIRRRH